MKRASTILFSRYRKNYGDLIPQFQSKVKSNLNIHVSHNILVIETCSGNVVDLFQVSLIIQMILSGTTFTLISWQRWRNGIKPLRYFEAIFGLAFLRSIVEYISTAILNLQFPYVEIHFLLFLSALLAFYFFGEYVSGMRPNVMRHSIIFLLSGGFIFFFSLAFLLGPDRQLDFWPLNHADTFYELPFDILQLTIFSYLLVVFIQMSRQASNPRQQRSTLLGMVAMLFMIIAAIIELLEFFTPIDITSALTTIPAFLLFFIVYLQHPTFAYASPVKVFRLIIISEDGPVLLNIDVGTKYDQSSIDTQLIGGMVSSFNYLFREITNEMEDNLESVNLGKTSFLIHKYQNLFFILEAEKSTRVLRRATFDFARDIFTEYDGEIKGDQSIAKNERLLKIISRYFPFYRE